MNMHDLTVAYNCCRRGCVSVSENKRDADKLTENCVQISYN